MFAGRGLETLSHNSLSSDETVLLISDNQFRDLQSLNFLPNLVEIIADNNYISEHINMPKLLKLNALSLNKNKINNLDVLLDNLVENAPNIKLLSLLGNPVSPDQIYSHLLKLSEVQGGDNVSSGGSNPEEGDAGNNYRYPSIAEQEEFINFNIEECFRFRLRILYRLPNLQFIDSLKVTDEERAEAKRRGQFLEIKRLDSSESRSISMKPNNMVSMIPGRITDWISTYNPLKPTQNNENFSPLDDSKRKVPKVCYGKNQYVYKGRYSEGNRFIENDHL